MFKLIDRYIVKNFVQTILFGLLSFLVIFIIIDLMENLDDFIDHNVDNMIVVEYYAVFIPEIIRLMLPVAVLLSALFTVGKMQGTNELTAMRSSGISIYRFMIPFLVTVFIISLGSIYFGGYIVPAANKHKVYIEQKYMKKDIVRAGNDIYFQDSDTRIVTISYYDISDGVANRVSIQEYDPDNKTQMIERYDADRMVYDSTDGNWILQQGIHRVFKDNMETADNFTKEKITGLNFSPKNVIMKQRKPEEMTLGELKEFAYSQKQAGNDPTRVSIEYHSRIAFAFTSFVVVLFGLPFSANKRRGGIAIQFGVSVLIAFVYLVLNKIVEAFGKNGVLDPIMTAWLVNIVFLVAALFYLNRINK